MNSKFVIAISLSSIFFGYASMMDPYSQQTMVRIQHKRTYVPIDSKAFTAEDANLSINYTPDIVEAGISVEFKNKTNKPLKIIWDECAYSSPDKKTDRIFHSGIKIADRAQSNPPTLIPPKSSLQDSLIPLSQVDWGTSGWEYTPLCGIRSLAMHELDDSMCINKEFGFFITYEIDGKKKNLSIKYKYVSKEPLQPKKQ